MSDQPIFQITPIESVHPPCDVCKERDGVMRLPTMLPGYNFCELCFVYAEIYYRAASIGAIFGNQIREARYATMRFINSGKMRRWINETMDQKNALP